MDYPSNGVKEPVNVTFSVLRLYGPSIVEVGATEGSIGGLQLCLGAGDEGLGYKETSVIVLAQSPDGQPQSFQEMAESYC